MKDEGGSAKARMVVPGAMLIGLLVSVGMVVRFWAWADITIRLWLFQFIMLVSGDLLGPDLHFTNLTYRFPMTVILQDPALSEGGRTFLSANLMRLTLEEIPVAGRAVQISEIRFFRPVLRFRWLDDGSLIGLNRGFIKSLEGEEYSDSMSTDPSDFLAIRVIQIVKGSLQFEPSDADSMHLDDISLQFDATPREGYPGLYRLDSSVKRPPVLDMTLQGAINIDTGNVRVENFFVSLMVDPTRAESLPDDIQGLVDRYRLVGNLAMRANGEVPLVDWTAGGASLDVELQLENSSSLVYGYTIPIPKMLADITLREKHVELDHLVFHLPRGGHATMTGDLELKDAKEFDVQFDVVDLHIEGLLEQLKTDHPRYTGLIGLTGQVSSDAQDVMEHLKGAGSIHLSNGDILNVPVVKGLQEAVLGKEEWPLGNDVGSLTFHLEPNRVLFDDVNLEGDHLGVRGEGELYFNKDINFRFNAGPLEKVQMNLGGIGDVFGFLTDRLVTYQVTGTWEDPRFAGRVLGLGTRSRSTGP